MISHRCNHEVQWNPYSGTSTTKHQMKAKKLLLEVAESENTTSHMFMASGDEQGNATTLRPYDASHPSANVAIPRNMSDNDEILIHMRSCLKIVNPQFSPDHLHLKAL